MQKNSNFGFHSSTPSPSTPCTSSIVPDVTAIRPGSFSLTTNSEEPQAPQNERSSELPELDIPAL